MTITRQCTLIAIIALALPAYSRAQKLSFTRADTAYKDAAGKQLSSPEGVACGPDGSVVVADTGNGRLLRYQLAQGVLRGGKEITSPHLEHPVRAQASSKGDVLVLDRRASSLFRLSTKDAVAGPLEFTGVERPSEIAIGSFTLDASDNLYVLDVKANRVLVASSAGAVTRQLELPDDAGVVGDLAVDKDGAIYAVDTTEKLVYKAAKTDKAFAVLTKDLGKELSYPTHLATNANRTLLVVTDRNGGGLVLLGLDGASLGRRLGMGAREGFVYYPSQVCMTKDGAIVVADRGNDRVQVFGGKR